MSKFRNYSNYEIYPDGKIWSYKKNRFLKPGTNTNGYQQVFLTDNEGNAKPYQLHRVVWESVTGEQIPSDMQINHRNEIKTDNTISNLELVSPKYNCNFGTRNSRIGKANTNNPKLSKAVGAFKDGKLVMRFQSAKEAERQGYNHGNVWSCCNGKLPHYKGYEWKYL